MTQRLTDGETIVRGASRRNGTEPPVEPPATRIRDALLSTEEVMALEAPVALVDGLLYLDSLAQLYGPSGVGKSFVAVDLALHIAHGAWWQRREVRGGAVLYVIAEGASGFGMRIDAWRRYNRMSQERWPMRWLPWAVNVSEPAWAGALADVVAEVEPALVVLDTFARCTTGVEENSAKDVGLVVGNLETIRRAAGSCVLLVHHSGKDLSAGSRGSTALKGALHTELELTGEAARFVLRNPKQKDAAEAEPISLGLRPVPGADSVAVDRPGPMDPEDLPAGVAQTLEALYNVAIPGGVSTNVWKLAAAVPERSFYRHRKGLLDQGLVLNVGSDLQPRYLPTTDGRGSVIDP